MGSVQRWEQVAVRGNEFVAHLDDFVCPHSGGCQWIVHSCLVDVIASAGQGCLNEQFVLSDVRLHVGNEFNGKFANGCELQARSVDQRWGFGDGVEGQVADGTAVWHVAINHAWFTGDDGVDNGAAVFVALVHFHGLVGLAEDLHALELVNDTVASSEVLVNGNVELGDHLLAVWNEKG